MELELVRFSISNSHDLTATKDWLNVRLEAEKDKGYTCQAYFTSLPWARQIARPPSGGADPIRCRYVNIASPREVLTAELTVDCERPCDQNIHALHRI